MKAAFFQIGGFSSRLVLICGVSLLTLPLAGCDMYEEGHINTTKIQVQEEQYSDDVPVSEVNEAYIDELASRFYKHGGGQMDVTVTYDPHSKSNTAMRAGDKAANIISALRAAGVNDLKGGVLPVNDQGDAAHLLVSFSSYTAHAPEGCDEATGLGSRSKEADLNPDYKIGCSVQTLMAKQVARPSDLLGKDNDDHLTDGRAASNIVDTYRVGAPNKPLEGETASEQ